MPYEKRSRATPYRGTRGGSAARRNTQGSRSFDRLLPEREYRLALSMDLVEEAKRAMLKGGLPAVRRLLRGD